MLDEHVELFEGALVKEDIDTLTRRQLATCMLRIYADLPAT